MKKGDLVQSIKSYIMEYCRKKKEPPSVRTIAKKFNISVRQFYNLFPNGLEGLCKELNVELPERFCKAKRVAEGKLHDDLAAALFLEFHKRKSLQRIVIEKKLNPDIVLKYYEKWAKLKGIPNINYALKITELEKRIKRIENFIEDYILERLGVLEEVLGINPY